MTNRPAFPIDLLACPDCRGPVLPNLSCAPCGRSFAPEGDDGILRMLPSRHKPLPAQYQDPDHVRYHRLYEERDAAEVYYANRNPLFRLVDRSAHNGTHRLYTADIAAGSDAEKNGWMLDVGCGIGIHLAYVPRDARVVGLDVSLGSLRAARREYPNAFLVQGDAYALPFRDGAFAHVFSIYNLEHLWFLDDALGEVERTLSPRGRFYVGLPTEGGLAWSLGRAVGTGPIYSRQYNIDYAKVMRIEHCNTALAVMGACNTRFIRETRMFWPFPFLPLVSPNLTISLSYRKRV